MNNFLLFLMKSTLLIILLRYISGQASRPLIFTGCGLFGLISLIAIDSFHMGRLSVCLLWSMGLMGKYKSLSYFSQSILISYYGLKILITHNIEIDIDSSFHLSFFLAFSVSVQLISSYKHGCQRMFHIHRKSSLPWGENGSVVEMFCMDIV